MINIKLVCHAYSVVVSPSTATDEGMPVANDLILASNVCLCSSAKLPLSLPIRTAASSGPCHLVRGVAKMVAVHALIRWCEPHRVGRSGPTTNRDITRGCPSDPRPQYFNCRVYPKTSEKSAFDDDNHVRPIIRLVNSSRRAQCNGHYDSSTQPKCGYEYLLLCVALGVHPCCKGATDHFHYLQTVCVSKCG
jgi:hypothetical protein